MILVIRGVPGAGASLCCVGQQGKCKEVKTESVKSSGKKKQKQNLIVKGYLLQLLKVGGGEVPMQMEGRGGIDEVCVCVCVCPQSCPTLCDL